VLKGIQASPRPSENLAYDTNKTHSSDKGKKKKERQFKVVKYDVSLKLRNRQMLSLAFDLKLVILQQKKKLNC
jgi:hypothetical protein